MKTGCEWCGGSRCDGRICIDGLDEQYCNIMPVMMTLAREERR